MKLAEFKSTLSNPTPPDSISPMLQALWHDANNNWTIAHDLVQHLGSEQASWIHAYLHRKEGDLGNASYWYHQAHRIMPSIPIEEEWEGIVIELLAD